MIISLSGRTKTIPSFKARAERPGGYGDCARRIRSDWSRSCVSDYLADTTVLIDYLRGREHVRDRLRGLVAAGHRLCCCDVTICELYTGMRPHERQGTERFLSGFHYLPG